MTGCFLLWLISGVAYVDAVQFNVINCHPELHQRNMQDTMCETNTKIH
jgi:hypothetical protein